jgi:hypothetical protein
VYPADVIETLALVAIVVGVILGSLKALSMLLGSWSPAPSTRLLAGETVRLVSFTSYQLGDAAGWAAAEQRHEGWLYLSDRRLIWSQVRGWPGLFERESVDDVKIFLSAIQRVYLRDRLGLDYRELVVNTRAGDEYRFVVSPGTQINRDDSRKWLAALNDDVMRLGEPG